MEKLPGHSGEKQGPTDVVCSGQILYLTYPYVVVKEHFETSISWITLDQTFSNWDIQRFWHFVPRSWWRFLTSWRCCCCRPNFRCFRHVFWPGIGKEWVINMEPQVLQKDPRSPKNCLETSQKHASSFHKKFKSIGHSCGTHGVDEVIYPKLFAAGLGVAASVRCLWRGPASLWTVGEETPWNIEIYKKKIIRTFSTPFDIFLVQN